MSDIANTKAQVLAARLSVSNMSIADIDSQIKDLQAKKKKMTSELDVFKDDLRSAMADSGTTRIESVEYGILFRLDKPSQAVSIDDETRIDEKFFRVKREIDKVAIKKALQVGDDVPGASLTEGKHRLTVKI